MAGTLDAINVIPRKLDLLGCPLNSFSVIWGARSASYLSRIFSGQDRPDRLTNDEATQMLALIARMESLAEAVSPLPINWRDSNRIRMTLDLCEKRKDFAAGLLALSQISAQ